MQKNTKKQTIAIHEAINAALKSYFGMVDVSSLPNNLYEIVLQEVEKPLLANVMEVCHDNQSKAAQVLGLNRNTLRKKLLAYKLLKL